MSFEWANKDSIDFMSKGYLQDGEKIDERVGRMADSMQDYINEMTLPRQTAPQLRDKFFEYAGKGFYSFSSPVLANFGNDRGLPISCNNVVVEDNMGSIMFKQAEVAMQTKHGAGTSGYLGNLRSRGSKINHTTALADGAVHFAQLFETAVEVVRQGGVRRGAFAAYFEADSSDIMEVLRIQEDGFYIQRISFGVCIGDDWMEEMLAGDAEKRKIWAAIISKRRESGYPYLFFKDNVNKAAPQVYKDKGLTILSSNLCTEVLLASTPLESFVCDLGSMNLALWPEWKDTDAVEVYAVFLDAVMEEYIRKTEGLPFMKPSNRFARNQRAIGIGTLGLHSLYQRMGLAFESEEARALNVATHKAIYERALFASEEMATLFGEPELLKGYGRRNATVCSVAPTTSSSFILGQVSPSIEPLNSNYFTKDLAKGKYTFRNPDLVALLERYSRTISDNVVAQQTWLKNVWRGILMKDGSVQHIECLTDHERSVFKTFGEISQLELIMQAADRQPFIDQGQSLNLMIHPSTPAKDIHELLVTAWRLGIKTLYYQRSTSPSQELARELVSCTACEA